MGRPSIYAPPRKIAPYRVYSAVPGMGGEIKQLRVGLFVAGGVAHGIDGYLAQMGSAVGMHQADFSLIGGHDVAASPRCLYEGIASRGTYAAPAAVQNNDVMTEYRTDAYDTTPAQVFGVGRIWFQVEGAPAAGIIPTGIYFGSMDAAGVNHARWRMAADGRFMPLEDAILDIGGDTTAEVRQICLFTGVRVQAVQVLGTRKTGWAAATGTATRTTFATGTVTLVQLAERVKALLDDLISHGIIGA